MQKTFVLGIAGQIASGKSARCQHLFKLAKSRASSTKKFLEPHILNADKVAHNVYTSGTATYLKIVDKFGEGVLEGGKLPVPLMDLQQRLARGEEMEDVIDLPPIDRKALGKIVFAEPNKLHTLNSIVWPVMDQQLLHDIEGCAMSSSLHGFQYALVILEAAVMVESGFFKHCDDVWLFTCDPVVAIERLKTRDGLNEEAAKLRLGAQRSADERLKFLERSGFSGGTRVFDTSKSTDLEQGLKEVTLAFDEWWEMRARPLIERKN